MRRLRKSVIRNLGYALAVALCSPATAALEIDNVGVSNITRTTAAIYGSVVSTNATNPVVTVYYGRTDAGTNFSNWTASNYVGSVSTGAVSTNITGLVPASLYYYRWYALEGTNTYDWSDASSNWWTLAGAPTNTPTVTLIAVMVDTNGNLVAPTNLWTQNGVWLTNAITTVDTGLWHQIAAIVQAGTGAWYAAAGNASTNGIVETIDNGSNAQGRTIFNVQIQGTGGVTVAEFSTNGAAGWDDTDAAPTKSAVKEYTYDKTTAASVFLPKAAFTAAGDYLRGTGSGAYEKRTTAETKADLDVYASTNTAGDVLANGADAGNQGPTNVSDIGFHGGVDLWGETDNIEIGKNADVDDADYTVTGAGASPDCTGAYGLAGTYDGSNYYARALGSYVHWFNTDSGLWNISTATGTVSGAVWYNETSGVITGAMVATGDASGTVTNTAASATSGATQIGSGTNKTSNTHQIGNYPLLDKLTGLLFLARLPAALTGKDADTVDGYEGAALRAGVDEAFGAGWNGDTDTPEKDDIYDYLVTLAAQIDAAGAISRYEACSDAGNEILVSATATGVTATIVGNGITVAIPADCTLLSMRVRWNGADSTTFTVDLGTNDMANSSLADRWGATMRAYREDTGASISTASIKLETGAHDQITVQGLVDSVVNHVVLGF